MRQTSLTKNYIIDLDQKLDKLIELYVAVLGERHRAKITKVLTEIPILFTGTNDKWIQFVRKVNLANKYASGDKLVPVANLEKVSNYVQNKAKDSAVTKDSLAFFDIIAKNMRKEDKGVCIDLLTRQMSTYTASCTMEASNDLSEVITYIHFPLEVRCRDCVLVHELFHAISTFIGKKQNGKAMYGSGLTGMVKVEGNPKEELPEGITIKEFEKLNKFNEMFTEYLTQKTIIKMQEQGLKILNEEEFVSAYNNGLLFMKYLFEKIEPELIDYYISGDFVGLKNAVGAERFNKLLDLSDAFFDTIPDILLVSARVTLEKVRTTQDMIKYADQLTAKNPSSPFFKKCLEMKNLTDEIVEQINQSTL